AADVIHLPHRGLQRGRRRLDAVVDEGVTPYLEAIAVDRDGVLMQQRVDEAMVTHVGALPRTVDREVAENDQGQPELFGVVSAQLSGNQFGNSIRGERASRKRLVAGTIAPVHGRRGGVNEAE